MSEQKGNEKFYSVSCPFGCNAGLRIKKKIYLLETEPVSQMVICKKCGIGFLDRQPSFEFLNKAYAYSYSNENDPSGYGRRFEREKALSENNKNNMSLRMDFLKKFAHGRAGSRLLDFGCGLGYFLKKACENGFEGYGLDISKEAVNFAKYEFGLQVWELNDKKLTDFPAGYFDVISLLHVLEHLNDPLNFLKSCRQRLNSDGLLLIAVPNRNNIYEKVVGEMRLISFLIKGENVHTGDFLRRSFEREYEIVKPLDVDNRILLSEYEVRTFQHLFYFSQRSLEKLVKEAGFVKLGKNAGYVSTGSNLIKRMAKNRFTNAMAFSFSLQEELLLVAGKADRGPN